MKTVLVTAIGSFAADIVIKKLEENGFSVIGCDIYRKELIADAYQVSKFFQAPLAANENEYIEFIKNLCKSENIEYIIPLTDVEVDVFNRNREWFEENNACLCISSKDTIDICRDKKCLADFMSKQGFIKTIPTNFAKSLTGEPQFPAVCKPYNGRSSNGLKYINNSAEWQAFIASELSKDCIVQPYIKGSVITVDVVRQKNGEKVVAVAREELLRTPNGAGTSVYVFSYEELEKKCAELADTLKIVGCVNFEFIKDESDSYYLLECNPRFSGGIEFSCMTGYDFVLNHIRCFAGQKIDARMNFKNMYIARKYEEYITKVE